MLNYDVIGRFSYVLNVFGKMCFELNSSMLHPRKQIKKWPTVNFINILRVCLLFKILVPKITNPKVIREKLPNPLLYEKGVCKMLMKLTPKN
jgi:hypothetical protein